MLFFVVFLLAIVSVFLLLFLQRQWRQEMADRLSDLDETVIRLQSQNQALIRKHREIRQTERMMIHALAAQAESRKGDIGGHLERTARYVRMLAEKMAGLADYADYITPTYISDLELSAPLHDIGNVAVPDSLLHKEGGVGDADRAVLRQHCEWGAAALERAESGLSFPSFLRIAIQLTRHHHERWDGSGYPEGLSEKAIPLSARIMAVADAYDTLRNPGSHGKPLDHAAAVAWIFRERGRHFDPDVVDAFLGQEDEFGEISIALADATPSPHSV